MGSFAAALPLDRQRFGHQRPVCHLPPRVPLDKTAGPQKSQIRGMRRLRKKIVDIAICPILSGAGRHGAAHTWHDAGHHAGTEAAAQQKAVLARPFLQAGRWLAETAFPDGVGPAFLVIGQWFEHLVDEGFIQPAALPVLRQAGTAEAGGVVAHQRFGHAGVGEEFQRFEFVQHRFDQFG